jgi:Ca-activated chloride channel family protein
MTDDLDALRKALKAAPDTDPARRAGTLARAMAAFDAHQAAPQETAADARPMSDRPTGAGFLTGVREMLQSLSTRGALAATASVAALGLALVMVAPTLTRGPVAPLPGDTGATTSIAGSPEPGANLRADEEQAGRELAGEADATAALPAEAPPAALQDAAPAGALGKAAPIEARRERLANQAPSEAAAGLAAPKAEIAPAAPAPADASVAPPPSTEAFATAATNPVRVAAAEPVSTFSVDVDTASWGVVRSSLMAGYLPPPEAVRIEEMVNYFPYAYPSPEGGGEAFRATLGLATTPWNPDTRLLRIGLQGAMPATDARPPLNLVFLIDTSGSMEDPNKLPLLKQSFRLMLGQLRPEDQVAIVTYAGSAGEVLEPTSASDQSRILAALDNLMAGGSTAGQEGIALAYDVARRMGAEGEVSRVLLATDGDFNVGLSDPEALKDYIARERASGIYLSVVGFGRGNLDDATMQALAQNGNGTASYIDTLAEAQKVLVDQLTGALFPIADDVKVQVEFNPATVAEYRLIGYETRALAREDFNNDRVDAGEIGAGLQVTALYEVTPAGSPAVLNDALRYQQQAEGRLLPQRAEELGFLKLRWKAPGEAESRLIETPLPVDPTAPDDDFRFAAAVAGMGQLLSEPKYLGSWGWAEAIALAEGARGPDRFGYRAEAVQLMRLGQSLSGLE